MSKRLSLSLLILVAFTVFCGLPAVFAAPIIPASQSAITKYYIPVNIVNTAGTATLAGFQEDLVGLPAYVNALAGNVYVFNGISGAVLPSWANATGSIYFNMLSNTIPSGGSANGIYYIGIGSPSININSAANQIGSYSYTSYDSGNIVFQVYDDFYGTSLKSFWTLGAAVASATVNNGLTFVVNSASNPGGSWTNTAMRDSGQGTVAYPAKLIADIAQPASSGCSGIDTDGIGVSGSDVGTAGILMSVAQGGWGGASPVSGTGSWPNSMSSATYYIASIYTSSSAFILNMNGITMSVGTGAQPTGVGFVADQGCGSASSATVDAKWILVAVAPPANIMPSTSYGALNAVSSASINLPASTGYGVSFNIVGTCLGTDTCNIYNTANGVLIATGTTTATYATGVLSVGAHTYNAVDSSSHTSSGTQTLTVTQGTPVVTLPSFPANQVYSSSPITITANIVSVNNQLTANVWITNINIASFTTQTTFNVNGNVLGIYTVVANTLGNGNYVAATTTNTFVIYVPFAAQNTIGIASITPTSSPFTWNTYYPAYLSVNSPSATLNYSLTQVISSTATQLTTNAAGLGYLPPPTTR